MLKKKVRYAGVMALSLSLLTGYSFAQETPVPNMMYGTPPGMPVPQGGRYPAPPMNPQMMQQMMAQQKQKMLEMQEKQKAEAQAQKQAMEAEALQQRQDIKPAACKHIGNKSAMMERMQQRDAHMERMEASLANIEKLMQEMITLMKSR